MQIASADEPFLKGEKFSNGLQFQLGPLSASNSNVTRMENLKSLVAGKKVIHVGCVDHLPLIEEKRSQGLWLHEQLLKVATKCVGVDISSEGCKHLREIGFQDIFCLDVIKDSIPPEITREKFDYLILGEMIEHVDNPVDFLSAIRTKFKGVASSLVTTTPNVFRFQNLVNSLRARECINSDHRYWFSPYTLAKVLAQAGFHEIEIETVWYAPSQRLATTYLKKIVGKIFPATKDCLIAKGSIL